MNEFEIDQIAQSCLTETKPKVIFPPHIERATADQIRHRILDIAFDCTPNWGITGVKPQERAKKRNWYFRDPQSQFTALERHANIDHERLGVIIDQAAKDLTGQDVRVIGRGLYGSYFYRRNALAPEDLDVLVIVESANRIEIDALRYRSGDLRRVYINPTRTRPCTDEIGLSIVSKDSFTPDNRSYVVTDSALVDISTTLSHGVTVDAPPLPPYIIVQNAQKIIKWGISSLLAKPFSLLSRIDEAIRMRQMLLEEYPHIPFETFALEQNLPSKADILLGMNDVQLLEISKTVINVLHEDERRIREYVAENAEVQDA